MWRATVRKPGRGAQWALFTGSRFFGRADERSGGGGRFRGAAEEAGLLRCVGRARQAAFEGRGYGAGPTFNFAANLGTNSDGAAGRGRAAGGEAAPREHHGD